MEPLDPGGGMTRRRGARDRSVGKRRSKRSRLRPAAKRQRTSSVAGLKARVDALARELAEAREQQTATSEVLKVISSSPGELDPVFQAMLVNALHICEAKFGILMRYGDGAFVTEVMMGAPPALVDALLHKRFAPRAGVPLDRMMRTKKLVHTIDAAAEAAKPISARLAGARSHVVVPMLKEDELIGSISIYRQEVRPFTDKQIELVQNFAAQAVIAIENTRLLNELRESLQQQTATADVLKVISRSTFDLKAVLDTLVESAATLCRADRVAIRLEKDGAYHHLASFGLSPEQTQYMINHALHPDRGSVGGRAVLECKAVQVEDVRNDPEFKLVPGGGFANVRTTLGVPLMREGIPIGVLVLTRSIVNPFTQRQIDLATTFADQAVIAIENVRLFDEVQKRTEDLGESLAQQTATADVLKVISRSTFDLQTVLDTLTASAARLCEADKAFIFRREGSGYRLAANFGFSQEFKAYLEQHLIKPGRNSLVGRTTLERHTVHIPDVLADPEYTWREAIERGEMRTMLGVPLMREGVPIGVFQMTRATVRPFTDKQIDLIESFADQAVIAIENVRLFDEIQDKSRQLAEASQHKSQFLANMSHELRTPLNAILGYNELIVDGIYGTPSEKMQAVLKRVESNGRHLLGLINAVLDLSKIEAGQFTLDLADYSLQNVAQTVYNAVEPLALDKKLVFKAEVQSDLPPGRGDERRLTQVLLNLVGNAIKFTDAGEVVIKADASDGTFNLAVRDTGPGISAADQAKLFQEFQQADNSNTRKKEGTGLGLAISKRIIEMHGGRIWIESQVGQGSTFFVTLPVNAQAQPAPTSN